MLKTIISFLHLILCLALLEPQLRALPFCPKSSWAHEHIQRMSVREKIGQLFVATIAEERVLSSQKSLALPRTDHEYIQKLIQEYHVGGILFLGTSTIQKQVEITRTYQDLSSIPLLVLEDLEWGLETRLSDAIRFPRNITLGAIKNKQLMYDMGYEIGKQCRSIGVHINLAPVVDVNSNPFNPVIGRRSFGEDPFSVAQLGKLYMQGMQDAGILTCAKHFPGHGDTNQDSHINPPTINHPRVRLDTVELYPFKELIAAGADAVMIGHLVVSALDPNAIATFSYPIVTDLLQKQLGFKGLIITDALNMGALKDYTPGEIELKAFNAGCDLFLCSPDIPYAITYIENALRAGLILETELNRRVIKILHAKEKAGLHLITSLNQPKFSDDLVHNPEAYSLKNKLYAEAVTLVQNDQAVVPIDTIKDAQQKIHIVQVGGSYPSAFVTALTRSTNYPAHYTNTSNMHSTTLQELIKDPDKKMIIVGIFDIEKTAVSRTFGIESSILDILKLLHQKNNLIVILFGNPYSLYLFENIFSYSQMGSAILAAYEDDPAAQEAAALIITGKLIARGKLPITVSKQYYRNFGL